MLQEHLGYLSDTRRLERYQQAIAQVVRAGDGVADLGCGTGLLGLLALQRDAAHVYAIDESALVDVARQTFARAGFSVKATVLPGRSQRIELPERVDVVVCDHVGYFGVDYGVIDILADARRRFLKPGGTLIPSRIRLCLAAVGSPKCHALANAWQAAEIPRQFQWMRGYSVNSRHAVNLESGELIGPHAALAEIDLAAENPPYFNWGAELEADRDGTVHGVAGWFDCELAPNVWMTNSPLAAEAIARPQAFLPIDEAVAVKAGQKIDVRIMLRPAEHLLAWEVSFRADGRRFRHSTWQGMLLSQEDLIRNRPGHVPRLSPDGQARMLVLGYCDGKRTVEDIERAVLRDHPGLFPSSAEISRCVFSVLGRDTQ